MIHLCFWSISISIPTYQHVLKVLTQTSYFQVKEILYFLFTRELGSS